LTGYRYICSAFNSLSERLREVNEILRGLGRRIREIRIQRGFKSQEEFADYCKMHRTFLGHLETGRKDFRLTTIIRVAQALGITLQELFAGLESGESAPASIRMQRRSIDPQRLLKEVECLERSVNNLKALTLTKGGAQIRKAAGSKGRKGPRTK
jgi:transcriptional regulator with XRE-family HTH domain